MNEIFYTHFNDKLHFQLLDKIFFKDDIIDVKSVYNGNAVTINETYIYKLLLEIYCLFKKYKYFV